MKRCLFALSGSMVLAGCQLPGTVQAPADETVTLQVAPSSHEGRQVQALVGNYTQASINHLVITLFKLDGTSAEVALTSTDITDSTKFTSPVTFTKLKQNTTYRIRAYAYKAAGTASADQISDDANSSVDVPVTTNDAPPLAKLQVKLIDVGFNGQATSTGTTIVPGGYADSGAEAIVGP